MGMKSSAIAVTPLFGIRNKQMRIFATACLMGILAVRHAAAIGDLDNGVWVGYQGWHLAKGDGSRLNQWKHWFEKNVPDAEHLHGDQWPGGWDEYGSNKLHATQMHYPDGRPVSVYTSYDYETVDLHVKWMKEYGIQGAYLQRQQNLIEKPQEKKWRDTVARNMQKACEKHGVKFAIMLANNAKTPEENSGFSQRIINDWKHLVDELQITASPSYARQEGRPVVAMWGFGNADRPITPAEAQTVVDFLTKGPDKYRAYVVGGVAREFLAKSPNSAPLGDWLAVYETLDMITPWRGVQHVNTGAAAAKRMVNTLVAEKAWCDKRGIEYMPVVFPGGSARGTKDTQLNNYPRRAGQYLWEQVNVVFRDVFNEREVKYLYVAMFDEIDEGSAVYKTAARTTDLPRPGEMVHNNFDTIGIPPRLHNLPEDWYLRLCAEIQSIMENKKSITSDIPINP